MKKFYSFLLVALLAMVGFTASAGRVNIVLDDISRVDDITVNGESIRLGIIGNIAVDFDDESTSYVTIYLKDGYFMKSVTRVQDDDQEPVELYSTTSASFPVSSYVDGSVYLVSTASADEFYDQSVTFRSDDYQQYYIQTSTYRSITPTSNDEVVKLALQDSPVAISPATYGKKIYKVTVNGVEQTERDYMGASVYAEVKDGDVVDITTEWPVVPVPLHFVLKGAAMSAITSITVNGEEVTMGFLHEDFTVNMGSSVGLNFDTNNFDINSVVVNGESIYWYPSWTTTVMDETTIEIDATRLVPKNVTIDIDDASRVNCKMDNIYYGDEVQLESGSHTYLIPAKTDKLAFEAANGQVFVKSISYTPAGGEAISVEADYSGAYNVPVAEGTSISITTDEITLDQTAVVYVGNYQAMFDSEKANPMYGGGMEGSNRDEVQIAEGYTVINFSLAFNPYSFMVYGGNPDADTKTVWVYLNDEEVAPMYQPGSVYQFNLKDGDVFKAYIDNEPAKYNVTFTVEGLESSPSIVRDRIVAISDTEAFAALQGTEIEISSTEAAPIGSVSVNDTSVEPNDEGKYIVIVDADSNIVIKGAGVGVTDINADSAAAAEYFNLQGIRINRPAKGQTVIRRQGAEATKVVVK